MDGECVVIEDDNDLEMAYTCAETADKRIKFCVKEPAQKDMMMSTKASMDTEMRQEEVKDEDEEMVVPAKRNQKKADKGIPRKALKNLIQRELESAAKETFTNLMKSQAGAGEEADAAMINTNVVEKNEIEHTGVACDGCGVDPILGVRYKCSVTKNFDYCKNCEENMDHPYPFLKIRNPSENPVVMMTILNEEKETEKPRGGPFGRGRGGHGGRGRGGHHGHGHGPHGHGPHGHGGGMGPRKWLKVLRSFMKDKEVSAEELHKMATDAGLEISLDFIKEKMDKLDAISEEEDNTQKPQGFGGCGGGFGGPGQWKNLMKAFCSAKNMNAEDVQQQAQAQGFQVPEHFMQNFANKWGQGNGGCGNGQWNKKRAVCHTKTAEHVHDLLPGQTVF